MKSFTPEYEYQQRRYDSWKNTRLVVPDAIALQLSRLHEVRLDEPLDLVTSEPETSAVPETTVLLALPSAPARLMLPAPKNPKLVLLSVLDRAEALADKISSTLQSLR